MFREATHAAGVLVADGATREPTLLQTPLHALRLAARGGKALEGEKEGEVGEGEELVVMCSSAG